jgi:acetyl-CoA C-acetyltransferase
MTSPDIFVVAATRTAIGTFGGSLKDVPLTQLATTAVREALRGYDVHRRRPGHRRDLRTRVTRML